MEDVYSKLERDLPPLVSRSAIPHLLGGVISSGRLANLDCLGKGPRRITLGRKVAYLRSDLIEWMKARGGEVDAKQPTVVQPGAEGQV